MSYRHWIAALFALAVLLILIFYLARPAGASDATLSLPDVASFWLCCNLG